ncbi:MAG: thioesterase family protein [Prevotellaceae bacterium]|nr:thioesterase family protein [Prevotellaceae bacterium]MCD8304488.1 thioesterase family protein [Prevotellaceae bacterium]
MTYTSRATVTEEMLAPSVGSGDLRVLSTPSLAALMENAAMLCVADMLPEGSTTVGSRIECSHLRPTPEGEAIEATATLQAVDGRRLTFNITAFDTKGKIGEATHVRCIVDRQRFLAKLSH